MKLELLSIVIGWKMEPDYNHLLLFILKMQKNSNLVEIQLLGFQPFKMIGSQIFSCK
jgi:hypothetical protein